MLDRDDRLMMARVFVLALAAVAASGCGGSASRRPLVFSGSALGNEAEVIRRQIARFEAAHPGVSIEMRPTPDASDQRHQLYVQWLNARATDPDVLQLDVVWTPEFAAAGWILGLDRFDPPVDEFFEAAVAANRWNGRLFALPWFVDVGMLYWRTDLVPRAPRDFGELARAARLAQTDQNVPFGFVWQGARYEGLVTVFVEYLGAFGGAILDERGRVTVDSGAGVAALTAMRDAIYVDHIVPPAVLTWQEEPVRFAFQNGQAVFMRNWPYAYALMSAPDSAVAGRFEVAPMPSGPGGRATATLGGSQLAINARSDRPDEAYALIAFLLEPEQMIERARLVGQFPPRRALYDDGTLAGALRIPPGDARRIIESAVPRPVTPVYTQLSQILQVALHRALTRQREPRPALAQAAQEMRALLARVGLSAGTARAGVSVRAASKGRG